EQQLVDKLLQDPSVLVLTETTSNLSGSKLIPTIDMLLEGLSEIRCKMLQPDLLLTFGGFVVSKKIKAFLRAYTPILHWHVDPYTELDTYFVLSKYFQTNIQNFLSTLLVSEPRVRSNYQDIFWHAYQERINRRKIFVETAPYSDFGVYYHIFN